MTACRAQNVHNLLKNRSKRAEVFLWKKQGDLSKSQPDFLAGLTGASGWGLWVTHLKKSGLKFLLFKPQKPTFSAKKLGRKMLQLRLVQRVTIKLHKKNEKDYEELFLLRRGKYAIIKPSNQKGDRSYGENIAGSHTRRRILPHQGS